MGKVKTQYLLEFPKIRDIRAGGSTVRQVCARQSKEQEIANRGSEWT